MLADDLNAVRYQGKRHTGFYEVYYLTAQDPTSGDAYWFRYTLSIPHEGRGEPEVGVWAIATPAANPKSGLALHDRMPLAKFVDKSSDEKGFRVEFGKFFLERNRSTGKVGTGDRSIEWDLKWEPNGIGFEHVGSALMLLRVASAAINAAHLSVAVEGTIKVGGKAIPVKGWKGQQAHTWGRKHADAWAWAHCADFAEDKDAVFEGLSARVRKLGVLLPAATPLFFRHRGVEHRWVDVTTLWSSKSETGARRWDFEAENASVLLRGTATAPADRSIGVELRDPDGESQFVAHATNGDLKLEVWKRVGLRWDLDVTLTSKGTTAFEVASRTRDGGCGRTLEVVDTKDFVEEAPKPAPKPAAPAAPAAAKPPAPAAPKA